MKKENDLTPKQLKELTEQTTDEPTEQRLTHSGMNWRQFQLLQKSYPRIL
jgi:hypothetical protein